MTSNRFPQYALLFARLNNLVQQKLSHEYESFRFYSEDLILKLRYLELICLRYKADKKRLERYGRRFNRYIENVKSESLSQKELQQESEILAEQGIKYPELLNLDIDSFFIFARIVLDRIPFLLKPLYRGIVTKQELATRGFKEYLDWFEANPKSVLDSTFYDKMISFRKWFYEKLRAPRNEIIVHPKHPFRNETSFNGKAYRVPYELQTIEEKRVRKKLESTELPEISKLFNRIIGFLEFLNEYFSKKLNNK